MDINGSVNVHSQSQALLRNNPDGSNNQQQAVQIQQETQSVDRVSTAQPVQAAKQINEDIVNTRVSEHQALSSGHKVSADEAVGSLIDVQV